MAYLGRHCSSYGSTFHAAEGREWAEQGIHIFGALHYRVVRPLLEVVCLCNLQLYLKGMSKIPQQVCLLWSVVSHRLQMFDVIS